MVTNLETDFIKYESAAGTAYYGYAVPGTDTSSKSWSIRQVVGTGASVSVSWNLNSALNYTAIWDNKESHFTIASASASISPTFSKTNETNTFGITKTVVDISWTEYPGVDLYKLSIRDQNGIIYNNLNTRLVNPYNINTNLFTTTTKGISYKFIGVPNMTYSISFVLLNLGEYIDSSLIITT